MKWGAHEIDGYLAAKHATKIRAAFRASINARKIAEDYLNTHPYNSDDYRLDRSRAHAWAIIHVQFDTEALTSALINCWAEAYVTGRLSAVEHLLNQARSGNIKKSTDGMDIYVDWSKWKPGSSARAALLRPEGSLQNILEKQNITIKGLDKDSYNKLGKALADTIELGLSPQRSAKLINDIIGDPARSLSIAITETSRLANLGAMDTYQLAGVTQWQWEGANPCPEICAEADGQIVNIGEAFDNGVIAPPAHPNCRCTILSAFGEEDSGMGYSDIMDSGGDGTDYEAVLAGALAGLLTGNPDKIDEAEFNLEDLFAD